MKAPARGGLKTSHRLTVLKLSTKYFIVRLWSSKRKRLGIFTRSGLFLNDLLGLSHYYYFGCCTERTIRASRHALRRCARTNGERGGLQRYQPSCPRLQIINAQHDVWGSPRRWVRGLAGLRMSEWAIASWHLFQGNTPSVWRLWLRWQWSRSWRSSLA